MKLIDMLVEETIENGWSWPERANCITQDSDREIVSAGCHPDDAKFCYYRYGWNLKASRIESFKSRTLADDYTTSIITREQYEAALAAKNEGWIEWGGGECPVPTGTLVDVRYRNGEENHHIGAGISFDDTGSNPDRNAEDWNNDGSPFDIISYRLHKPQQAEQPEASEEDLNECIGQNAAPVWNGEGLPSVGCECERSWAGDEWKQCKILFASNQIVVVKLKESGIEDAYNIGDVTFRPIRSEAERKREKAVQALCNAGGGNGRVDEESGYGSCWFDIYDAIAAGKIPGVKLED